LKKEKEKKKKKSVIRTLKGIQSFPKAKSIGSRIGRRHVLRIREKKMLKLEPGGTNWHDP
jgi:hypothetical protein